MRRCSQTDFLVIRSEPESFDVEAEMAAFPRTQVEDVSFPRLLIGTNWFLGYSHTSQAKTAFIKEHQDSKRLADIIEVFLSAGVDAILGIRPDAVHLENAIKDAEDRTGVGCLKIGTPHFDLSGTPDAEDNNKKELDGFAEIGTRLCMPHQSTTDAMVNKISKSITGMDGYCALIRERGMIPGLSTHMPESVPYADNSGLDVATYIQIYNAAGFLMQVEVDWVHRIIQKAQKPVITIKPLAAGRLLPLVGLAFNWATIRDRDMVCIGCLTPDEARECIDISLSQLGRTESQVELQTSRSKKSLISG